MNLIYIHWNIEPEIINVLGISVRYYGLLFATGLVLSGYILKWVFRKENIPAENLEKLSIYAVVGILVGARLGHCFFYDLTYFSSHPLEILANKIFRWWRF